MRAHAPMAQFLLNHLVADVLAFGDKEAGDQVTGNIVFPSYLYSYLVWFPSWHAVYSVSVARLKRMYQCGPDTYVH